ASAPTQPPVRKPKPVVSHTYTPAYAPAPLAPPPPPQAAAAAPPAAPVATTQAVADDDGPVVRPPMPLR
ncbi:signal recognition particle-docking protein FtsY, partial [Xanthomonas citri pv. citri]